MAKLIYATPTSLDGYIADETGNPDWAGRTRRDLLSSTMAVAACKFWTCQRGLTATLLVFLARNSERREASVGRGRCYPYADRVGNSSTCNAPRDV
jgi:hypothetical protein